MNYIPNIISGLRILLIPIFAYFLLHLKFDIALFIFLIMGLSDAFDGLLARYLKCETLIGSYLDASADKIMINISLYLLFDINIIPLYIVIIVITRDIIMLIGIIYNMYGNKKVSIDPIFSSKINTFIQIVLIIYCLLYLNNIIKLNYLQDLINVVIFTTIFSAIEYIYRYKINNFLRKIKIQKYESINSAISKKH